ncbi:MAG: hypothetical protein K8T90_13820 [Planctomycetes bacterium]|nr:hypothetical protein [Planctomycetota bacterium]
MSSAVRTVTEDGTAAELGSLSASALARLMKTLGVTPQKNAGKNAREVARIFHQTTKVETCVAELEGDSHTVFLVTALSAPGMSMGAVEERAWLHGGVSKDRCRAALQDLVERGLIASAPVGGTLALVPHITAACPNAIRTWLARSGPRDADPIPRGFLMAAMAALVIEDCPRVTQESRPYARWLDDARRRMLHPACPPHSTDQLFNICGAAKFWRIDGDAAGRRLGLAMAAAETALRLSREDREFAGAAARGGSTNLLMYGWALAERAFAATKSDDVPFEVAVRCAREMAGLESQISYGIVPWQADDPAAVAEALGFAATAGHVQIARGNALTTFRRAPPESATGRWTVLPSFDVLVPCDTPADAVLRLATVARLTRLDRVATFTLDRASVARRAAVGGVTASALEILAERSAHPLPDAVAASVADWDQAPPAMQGFIGGVIVTKSAQQAALVRADSAGPREIAPGVFFVAETRMQQVLDRMRKQGAQVGTVERSSVSPGFRESASLPDFLADAARFRKSLHAVVTAPAPKAAPALSATADSSLALEPEIAALVQIGAIGRAGLRTAFPHIFAAVSTHPTALEHAARLPKAHLAAIPRGRPPHAIREDVVRLSRAWVEDLRETNEAMGTHEDFEAALEADGFRFEDLEDEDDANLDDDSEDAASHKPPQHPPLRLVKPAEAPPRADGKQAGGAPTSSSKTSSSPSSASASSSIPWAVHPIGELRRRLLDAAALKATVEIMYVNGAGRQHEREIIPVKITTKGGNDWLECTERALAGSTQSLRLDRISAIRG